MKYLLDTNVSLWYIAGDENLPTAFREIIDRPDSAIHVSVASIWEIAIKYSLKRLDLKPDLETFLRKHVFAGGFHILPVQIEHALRVAGMPFHHRDLFDRLLVAQSLTEGLQLLYTDPSLDSYR
ncbi:MAG: type II toxin-antitoxin system VapC family toxin [Phycisphaerae bacterium]|nr:type II toxin-antitoxin system VapC family toxin [Phycisphaerae bacterium]